MKKRKRRRWIRWWSIAGGTPIASCTVSTITKPATNSEVSNTLPAPSSTLSAHALPPA